MLTPLAIRKQQCGYLSVLSGPNATLLGLLPVFFRRLRIVVTTGFVEKVLNWRMSHRIGKSHPLDPC